MRMRRLAISILVAAMAGCALGAWMALRGDFANLRDAGAQIREQAAILDEVKEERRVFQEQLEETAKSLRADADSTAGSKGRAVLDMSFIAGKEQILIDQKQSRAEKRLAFQTERRDAAKKKLVRWGAGLGVVEAVLLAALFVVTRRARSGPPA
jgi:hypothetical protein